MKAYTNKKTIKNLIIIISIVTILSTLVPTSVQAKTDTEDGGGILHPIENFVLFLCDKVMGWLQKTFVTTEDIKVDDGVWNFQYSPAIIFSGEVPAFDINFITPGETRTSTTSIGNYIKENEGTYRAVPSVDESVYEQKLNELNNRGYDGVLADREYVYRSSNVPRTVQYDIYYYIEGNTLITETFGFYGIKVGNEIIERTHIYGKIETPMDGDTEIVTTREYESTAAKLQGTIASWYRALRRIALVGLLSVLVYVGIKMVTSSVAGEKAKYKAMMKDWLVAICLLFTLHYIMSITITVTNEISKILIPGESDVLLNTLREEIFSIEDRGIVLGKTIMYTVIVILTVDFTIQYLKRVIFIAFYTLIAPLITLTYPLDKIKDGQAQAFNLWIREYLYTSLTQVIHLVIYTVMVGSALELVSGYPLYAIIVMLFIKKADGIIKKMFGFDNSDTVGTLGAAATGALVVNGLNTLARKRRLKIRRIIR